MWVEILLSLFLGICAICDGMRKEIPLAPVLLGIFIAVILRLQGIVGEETWRDAVLSVVPGIVFWGLSFISGEKVGYGDGWMLIMAGLFIGLWKCFLILLIGLVAESVAALILVAIKKVSGNEEIPFAPFLFLGMGVLVCL